MALTTKPLFYNAWVLWPGYLLLGAFFSLGWYTEVTAPFTLLLFVLWAVIENKSYVFFLLLGYYCVACWEVLFALHTYYGGQYSWWFIVSLWLAHSALLALPWALLAPLAKTRPSGVIFRLTTLLLLTCFPPLGALNWLHPIASSGHLFPGFGWGGIAFVLIGLVTVMLFLRKSAYKLSIISIAMIFLVSLYANLSFTTPTPPKNWVAINTQFNPTVWEPFAFEYYQQRTLMKKVMEAIEKESPAVIILPENAISQWQRSFTLWEPVINELKKNNSVLVSGANQWINNEYQEGVLFVDKEVFISSRQPLPFATWNPFSKRSARAHWLNSGVVTMDGIHVWLSICYEDIIVWTNLLPMLHHPKPEIIISLANWWWNVKSAQRKQTVLIQGWANLFRLPLIQAVNT